MPSPLIDIPPEDIFKNDRLGLEPAIAGRTHALLSRSPQAIAIDGGWGTGKSTFLALWAAYLRSKEVKVVRFNAWKSFGADPFDALTKEILRQVDIPRGQQEAPHEYLLDFVRRCAPIVTQGIRLVSIFQPELEEASQAAAVGIDSAANVLGSESSEPSDPKIESPDEFAVILSAAAKTWSDRPVVVMVDELDRCSPEYSVEFLQLLEHVFHAEHVVFVVAINRSELHHSIKSFYGQGFNAEGYLERFFDDIFALPISNRSQYIESSLQPVEFGDKSSALLFLEASKLSLREIDKAIQVILSVHKNYHAVTYTLLDLWLARTLAPEAFRQFTSNIISDKELADAVFANGNCSGLRTEGPLHHNNATTKLEANLCICSGVLSEQKLPLSYNDLSTTSKLFRHYQEIVTNGTSSDESVTYAKEVVSLASSLANYLSTSPNVREVVQAARLLERELPPE